MTEPLQTIGYIQDGLEYSYLDDVNQRAPYFILRSDGSITRDAGMGGNSNVARVQGAASGAKDILGGILTGNIAGAMAGAERFASDPYAGSGNGQPLSGKSIAAIKNYLNRMYNLANIPDEQAWSWLQRATRIDDATAGHESFENRLIDDIVRNEAGGDPAQAEAVLKQVMGEENFNAMAERQIVRLAIPEQGEGQPDSVMFAEGIQKDFEQTILGDSGGSGRAGGDYTIQAGDTLSEIAARFGTPVEAMAEPNGITDPNKIIAGSTLTIPGAGASGAEGLGDSPVAQAAAEGSAGAGDVQGAAAGSAGASASGGGLDYGNMQPGVGPDGSLVTPELLQEFVESDWHLAWNAVLNGFRNAGAAAIFMNWVMQQGQRFLGEYEGNITQQALNGQVPTGTWSEFLAKKTGMLSGSNMPTGISPAVQSLLGSSGSGQNAGQTTSPTGAQQASEAQPGPGPLPAGTPAQSPSAGETAGLTPLSPQMQQLLGISS